MGDMFNLPKKGHAFMKHLKIHSAVPRVLPYISDWNCSSSVDSAIAC